MKRLAQGITCLRCTRCECFHACVGLVFEVPKDGTGKRTEPIRLEGVRRRREGEGILAMG